MQQASTTKQTRPFSCWLYLLIVCGLSWPFQLVSAIWGRDLFSVYALNATSMLMVTVGTLAYDNDSSIFGPFMLLIHLLLFKPLSTA